MDISVLIVNYNTADLVGRAIESALAQQGVELEVVVVDNASSDASLDVLRGFGDRIALISSRENLGFGRANNLAARQASGRHVYLLNPDAWIEQCDVLSRLVAYLDAHPRVGVLGTTIRTPAGRPQSRPKSRYGSEKHLGHPFANLPGSIAWVIGASMALPRAVYVELGGFDEDFFLYGEDADLCLRARKQGYEVAFHSDLIVYHVDAASEGQTSAYELKRKKLRSSHIFSLKHFGESQTRFLVNRAVRRASTKLGKLRLLRYISLGLLFGDAYEECQAIVDEGGAFLKKRSPRADDCS